MAAPENDLLVGPTVPAASVTVIAVDFFVESEAWIEVYKSGSETPMTLGVDYTFTGEGTDTGYITLTTPANGTDSYAVYLAPPAERASDLQFRGDLRSPVLNLEFDRLVRMVQNLKTDLARTFRFSKNSNIPNPLETLTAASRMDKTLAFSSDGTGLTLGPTTATITTAAAATAADAVATAADRAQTGLDATATAADAVSTAANAAAASSSASAASASATAAATSEANAAASETAAASSASGAASSAASASTSATNAASSASAAATSETNAAASATAAAASEAAAGTSATSAASSASAASSSATAAAASASAASTSETNAAASATAAASSAAAAEVAKIEWQGAYNAGTAYAINDAVSYNGASYIAIAAGTGNTPTNPSFWDVLAERGTDGAGSGDMLAANNLSDLADKPTARTNLGVAIGTHVQAYSANLAAFAGKTAPSGTVVGTTDTQTLSGKTITNLILDGQVTEEVYTVTGTTPSLDPANGTIQVWTLTANSTPTDGLATGESLTLMVADGTAYTITWPTMTWVGGSAPTLATSGYSVIVLWKVSTTLYGMHSGDVA